MGDELVLRGLATAHLLQVSGTIAQRGASWLQRARTGGLVRLDLTPTRAAGAAPLRPFAIDARVCVHGDPNPVVEIGDSFSDLPASPTGWTKPSSNVSEPFSQRPA